MTIHVGVDQWRAALDRDAFDAWLDTNVPDWRDVSCFDVDPDSTGDLMEVLVVRFHSDDDLGRHMGWRCPRFPEIEVAADEVCRTKERVRCSTPFPVSLMHPKLLDVTT